MSARSTLFDSWSDSSILRNYEADQSSAQERPVELETGLCMSKRTTRGCGEFPGFLFYGSTWTSTAFVCQTIRLTHLIDECGPVLIAIGELERLVHTRCEERSRGISYVYRAQYRGEHVHRASLNDVHQVPTADDERGETRTGTCIKCGAISSAPELRILPTPRVESGEWRLIGPWTA